MTDVLFVLIPINGYFHKLDTSQREHIQAYSFVGVVMLSHFRQNSYKAQRIMYNDTFGTEGRNDRISSRCKKPWCFDIVSPSSVYRSSNIHYTAV